MARLRNFQTWRARAKRRLPRKVFDFIDGGADDEVTLRRNRTAFDDLSLVSRQLVAVEAASAELDLLGRHLQLPVLLGPAGDSRFAGPQADLAQARGASAGGTISILSAAASIAPDQVAAATPDPPWCQVFLYRDRDFTLEVVAHLKRLGFSALVLTADGAGTHNRERDKRNGMALPLRPTPRTALDAVLRPSWTWGYYTNEPSFRIWDSFTNEPTAAPDRGLAARARAFTAHRRQPPLAVREIFDFNYSWEDLHWLRSIWDGPLLLKGVMCGGDAELALAAGCDGLIVSNHGGRELDAAPASIEVLPEIVSAVDGRAQVLIDGGIRRGTDVVKALCLGATACLVARPWLFALAAAGEDGVRQMLEQFQREVISTMQFVGVTSLDQLGPHNLRRRPGSGWEAVARQRSEHAPLAGASE